MIKPEGCKVLVEADKVDEKKGAIYVPRTVQDKEQVKVTKGTVLDIGPTANVVFADGEETVHLKVGDRVIFAKYGGLFLDDERPERDLRIVNDEDIVAKLN